MNNSLIYPTSDRAHKNIHQLRQSLLERFVDVGTELNGDDALAGEVGGSDVLSVLVHDVVIDETFGFRSVDLGDVLLHVHPHSVGNLVRILNVEFFVCPSVPFREEFSVAICGLSN